MSKSELEKHTRMPQSFSHFGNEAPVNPLEHQRYEATRYYILLAKYALGRSSPREQHDSLCRLLVMIAGDWPNEVASNPGAVRKFPKVKVLHPDDPSYGDLVEPTFNLFVGMFYDNDDFTACTGLKGTQVFFLTLSLWYEVCQRRNLMRLDGVKHKLFEREVEEAQQAARNRAEQEAAAREYGRTFGRPHFSVDASDEELLLILQGFKEAEWHYNRVKTVGFFEGDVSNAEWLAAMKGPSDERPPLYRKIPLRSKYICRSFTIQYLDSDYDLAEQVFCRPGGKDIKNLKNTNIYKNAEICDLQTGLIAQIIRSARKVCGREDG